MVKNSFDEMSATRYIRVATISESDFNMNVESIRQLLLVAGTTKTPDAEVLAAIRALQTIIEVSGHTLASLPDLLSSPRPTPLVFKTAQPNVGTGPKVVGGPKAVRKDTPVDEDLISTNYKGEVRKLPRSFQTSKGTIKYNWTTEELDRLRELVSYKRYSYAKIAEMMTKEFGRAFTHGGISIKYRKHFGRIEAI